MADENKPPEGSSSNVGDIKIGNIGTIGTIGIIGIPFQIDINQVLNVLDASTNITTIDQYNQLKPQLVKAVGDLKTYLQRQDTQISSLQNQVTSLQTQNQTLQSQNNDLNNQVAALNNQIAQLKAQLQAAPKTALPLHVAQSFKNVVDQIQADARSNPGAQTTISNMQIAVKALVNVQPGADPSSPSQAVLVFPDPSQLPDPNLLSTLTLNFAAIPNVKRQDGGTTPTPTPSPTPAPTPAPTPSPAPFPGTNARVTETGTRGGGTGPGATPQDQLEKPQSLAKKLAASLFRSRPDEPSK